jgi:hypothetical protein
MPERHSLVVTITDVPPVFRKVLANIELNVGGNTDLEVGHINRSAS